jgi:hypothetical protein
MADMAEELLKKTAVTFASEAISSDVKKLLTEKIDYNLRVFDELNKMVQSVTQCKDRKIRRYILEKSPLFEAIEAVVEDQKAIMELQYMLLVKLLKEREQINLEFENDSPDENTDEKQ